MRVLTNRRLEEGILSYAEVKIHPRTMQYGYPSLNPIPVFCAPPPPCARDAMQTSVRCFLPRHFSLRQQRLASPGELESIGDFLKKVLPE